MTDAEIRKRRALFRATHRGTKEMDWLLGRYARANLEGMKADDLSRFEQLLSLPDPDLNAWILDPNLIEDCTYAPMIQALRVFHRLDA